MTKTAIIYARVSTVRQADDGLPVESQIEQCKAKAEELGAEVKKIFRDDGISGRVGKRPGFDAAFDYCEMEHVDFFVCWSTSRFGRNYIDAAQNKKLLAEMKVKLIYVSQSFGEDDDGWMAEAITEVIDERYSRQVSKDTRRSMTKNAEDGFFNGGRVPFGFKSEQSGKRHKLQQEPTEAPTVRTIFRWCLEGLGTKEIAARLNSAGVSRRGCRWVKAGVASILRSRAACGQLSYFTGGREIVANAHEGIITIDEWLAAQEAIAERRPQNHGGRPKSHAVFVGMLRCGACGDAMTTETATGRGGVRYNYYNCRSWLKAGTCKSRRLPVAALDQWLLAQILEKVFTRENMQRLVVDLKTSVASWVKDREDRLAVIEAEGADVARRLKRLYDAVEAGAGLELSDVAERIRELQGRKKELKRQEDELMEAPRPETAVSEADMAAAIGAFKDIVAGCDDPKRIRRFLSGIIRQAVLDGSEVRVEYYPERVVTAGDGGSLCEVGWLPDISTVRTAKISLSANLKGRSRAAL